MEYMTAYEAADTWGVPKRCIVTLCNKNKIPGAQSVGAKWFIPSNANKPEVFLNLVAPKKKPALLKPFVKWAGGKGQLLADIRKTYPSSFGTTIKKYAEPFVGGGAILFDVLTSYSLDAVYISDVNAELINTYRMIRDESSTLIELLMQYENEYLPMEDSLRKDYYYEKRIRFNKLKLQKSESNNPESAALFIFLNRTCFNGLYRVNSKGLFNVPMGSYKKPTICDAQNLLNISSALQNVQIVCGDYRKSSDFIDAETFVYFDPPYRPLNATSTFTSYTENGFDDKAQQELAEYVNLLTERGAKIVLSNSDPKNENPQDDFFDKLYVLHQINRVEASRMINSNAESRGKISELLICNY